MLTTILALALQAQAAAPMAAAEEPVCTAAVAPPAELAGWTRMAPVTAGASADDASTIRVGRGARATLLTMAKLQPAATLGKASPAGTSGGLFAFTVDREGRYRVAAGAGAWLDVVHDGQPVASVAHKHGPACSGIRKMVDFQLQPGRYLLQVADAPAPTIGLLVARLPARTGTPA